MAVNSIGHNFYTCCIQTTQIRISLIIAGYKTLQHNNGTNDIESRKEMFLGEVRRYRTSAKEK